MLKKKIIFIIILVIILTLIVNVQSNLQNSPDLKCPNCNVILIGVDTLRADHLSSYGYEKIKTPNIDSLANQGVLFKNNFSQSINTTPSFMSIFTSLYPTDHGILYTSQLQIADNLLPYYKNRPVKINNNIKTLPQILKENGYKTQGFATSPAVSSIFGFGQGFDNYNDSYIETERKNFIDFLKKPKNGKFFVFFHDLALHSPYDTKTKFLVVEDGKIKTAAGAFLDKFNSKNPEEMTKLAQLYDQGIQDEDNYINLVLQTLKEQNLMDKTIVVFISDHGEELGDHGLLDHLEFYNEITHVPLIIYSPTIKKPVVIDQKTRSIDVMPTILDILGIKTNVPMRGISLLSMITNPKKDLNLPIISIMGVDKSVIWNNYKFIDQTFRQPSLGKPTTLELYDLKNDPLEKNNLINQNLPIQRTLQKLHTDTISTKGYAQPPIPIQNVPTQEETLDKIRSLGY